MKILGIIIISIFSGILAGMGMGGGTFLIPSLSLFFETKQAICQSTNVICFIVLGVICFFIYKKNKLIDFKVLFFVSLPACIISAIFTYFSVKINSDILKNCFSIFIMIFGVIYLFQTIMQVIGKIKINKNN